MALTFRRGPKSANLYTIIPLFVATWFFIFVYVSSGDGGLPFRAKPPNRTPPPPVELVIASMKRENTTWVHHHLGDWSRKIYVVDDPDNALTVPVNKGREAMVFLTYLIDHYHALPDVTIFTHASRYQWHNDDPDYDLVPELRRLNLSHVRAEGYTNLRCVWLLGCPVEIRPIADEIRPGGKPGGKDGKLTTKQIFKPAFQELLPEFDVPEEVGVSCCSQFAVTRETVLRRPRGDYVRYRKWLIETPLEDDLSGRVLEYAWHIIFGKKAIHCPRAQDCYCNLWGLCDLKCTEQTCEGRYQLPKSATFPKGWPRIGWDGEQRKVSSEFD